uniref:Uncharacterized protein n=1 Tax=viral metagenome TaxID=1070528 RepID=A0A6C0APX9_9ZZZZ
MDALKQLSNYKDLNNIPYILFGALVIDLVVIAMTKSSLLGTSLKVWYDNFGLSAVIADTLILVLGILIAQYVYTEFFSKSSPIVFLVLIGVIQLVHDILFYKFAILGTPKGQNRVMDLFKTYAKELNGKILGGDLAMILGSAGVAAAATTLSKPLFIFLSILAVYTVPYIIA